MSWQVDELTRRRCFSGDHIAWMNQTFVCDTSFEYFVEKSNNNNSFVSDRISKHIFNSFS